MTGFDDFRSIALFSDLSDAELDLVKPLFREMRVEANACVICEGELGETAFVLVEGKVRVTKSMLVKGMQIPLAELRDSKKTLAVLDGAARPVFGEMALLDRDVRSASVETLESSLFLVLDHVRFFELVEREPALGVKLLSGIARRLAAVVRKNNQELVKLTTALALALSRRD